MKKYVRLKDKIVKIEDEDSECYYFNKLKKFVYKDEDYKTANTIIDLCDGVLVEEKDNPNKWFIMKVEEFKATSLDKMMIKCFNFKAFVKTDKGLIYVGGVNKEGELELWED